MRISFSLAIQNDAGLLREYLAANYGQSLRFGCSFGTYNRAVSLARRLSRMTGLSVASVLATACADSETLYA